MEVLKQPQYRPMPVEEQVLILYAPTRVFEEYRSIAGFKFQKDFIKYVDVHAPRIKEEIRRQAGCRIS